MQNPLISLVSWLNIQVPRQCTIEIRNDCSNYNLCNPSYKMTSGCCTEPLPPRIKPSASGRAKFSKTPYSARGAVGVFTYDLVNKTSREVVDKIAIMFSVPYDYILYENIYAVGISDKKCNEKLVKSMYDNHDGTFARGNATGPVLSYETEQVTITATMSETSEPIMKVVVSED